MNKGNRAVTLIAWRKREFVAHDMPMGRPADYYTAVNETEKLFQRLMRSAKA
ncbi:hypothetical protein [Paraburkholderia mimosarum]|uniref:hypothetical protein n=1 Tax=Paraburkholderia mimosarum TaxID=312026 RepID=UPI0004126675|nr:hypothetical protein [Paraburkholderia mimosarum]